jgi:CubicO group peptidase (beta-lactamase class C family)
MTRRTLISQISLTLCGLLLLAACSGTVADGKPNIWPQPDWVVSSPAQEGLSDAKLEQLKAMFAEKKTQAALVIRHGKIVAEWYWDGKDKDTRFQAFSVTKSISSTAIGMLVKDGKVKLEQSASDFIPEWKYDSRKAITVRHLITMSSGLANKDNTIFGQNDQLGKCIALPQEHEPGTVWNYNNGACDTLSQVISAASGMEMNDFLTARLYKPLGITNFVMDKSSGKTLAYMGLHTSARELAKIGYLFLHDGKWKGKELLPKGWVKAASSTSQDLNKAYGYLWWVRTNNTDPNLPKDSYSAVGLGGQYVSIFPDQDLIVVRLTGLLQGAASDIDADSFARVALEAIKQPVARAGK